MSRFGKVAALCCTVALSLTAFAAPALAGNAHYYYDFQKGGGVHVCGPASKDDGEQSAYITVRSDGDVYFVQGSSLFGTRVRTLDGTACTGYHTWTYAGTYTMSYSLMTGYPGWQYNLHGQVDDSSGTDWVRIWGYWCP